jgi:small-conductance mechanosensitive channel
MLTLDSDPIWKEFRTKKDSVIVFEQQRSITDDAILGLRDFYSQYQQRIWLHLVLSILIIIFIFIIYSNLRHSLPEEDSPEINAVKAITAKPLASGWLLSAILTFVFYSKVNDIVVLLISFVILPPVIIILRMVISGHARKYIYFPLLAIVLVELHRIFYGQDLLSRLWLMGLILFSIFSLYLVFGRKSYRRIIQGKKLGKLLIFFSFISFGMLVIAFFANIAGAVSLAEFFGHSVIESATVSLFIYALVVTLNSIITTTIYSNYLRKSHILSQYQDLILKRLKGLVNIIAIYLLINLILRIFNVWDVVFPGLKSVLTYSVNVGTMSFSLWNIIMFFFIIWITIQISRLIRNIFESEVRIRDRMRKGAPGAMSLLLRIAIFTVGFLLAIAAAGVQMDRLAILLGAFGVGIGFGLQNIFNNLVSGIIIAFERPIKEGDIIEVGSLLGIVKEIGIRSSVIRTYDGSEVVTPNGNLISNDLINWTRADMRRRAEVQVGVAYGTDPQRVIDLLLDTCGQYEKALKQPAPLALFTGFGDSSLNFRLLFWIEDADVRLILQSEMAVRVNEAIVAAGITIPFPQRDLHVKTVDPLIIDRVRAQDGIAEQQKGKSKD